MITWPMVHFHHFSHLITESESGSDSVVSNYLQPHGLYSPPGVFQARIVEWVAFPFSGGSSQPKYRTQVSHIVSGFFTS